MAQRDELKNAASLIFKKGSLEEIEALLSISDDDLLIDSFKILNDSHRDDGRFADVIKILIAFQETSGKFF